MEIYSKTFKTHVSSEKVSFEKLMGRVDAYLQSRGRCVRRVFDWLDKAGYGQEFTIYQLDGTYLAVRNAWGLDRGGKSLHTLIITIPNYSDELDTNLMSLIGEGTRREEDGISYEQLLHLAQGGKPSYNPTPLGELLKNAIELPKDMKYPVM